jgi:two-component system CheB/CheR fusion protein
MSDIGVADFSGYRDLLETNAEEFRHLFNTILINVTGFFRDADAWAYVENDLLPDLLAGNKDDEIRVWSAGCSTGEEAYSLAILFGELLGVDESVRRVKIYATDADEDALREARSGAYTEKAVEPISQRLRDKYFEAAGDRYVFRPDLRRRVIFGRHDLTRDAPISRLDLLVCRNTLMYFNTETQKSIIDRFHFALRESGYLMLGKAEMLLSSDDSFEAINVRQRVFRRIARGSETHRLPTPTKIDITGNGLRTRLYRDLVLDVSPNAIVGVDLDQRVALVNNEARALFGLTAHDVGRPFRELELSFRPVELRSHIEQAFAERRSIRLPVVERRLSGHELQYFEVLIAPLRGSDGTMLGVAVVFTDCTHAVRLQHEVKRSREDLETAYEELQSTNEELETTNEELQSSIEELETTNEELQSTNEELETTNEELQASNEELETMNDEMRMRGSELEDARRFLHNVLASVETAVIALDADMRVVSWNRAAEALFGFTAAQARTKRLADLHVGLNSAQVTELIEQTVRAARPSPPMTVLVQRSSGRSISCRIVCTPLGGTASGTVLVIDALPADAGDGEKTGG